jgi:hypothetical protein
VPGLGTGRAVEANSDHGRLAASRRANSLPVFELCGAHFDFVNAPTDFLGPGSDELGDRQRTGRIFHRWSRWALLAALLTCDAVDVAEVIAKVHILFG